MMFNSCQTITSWAWHSGRGGVFRSRMPAVATKARRMLSAGPPAAFGSWSLACGQRPAGPAFLAWARCAGCATACRYR